MEHSSTLLVVMGLAQLFLTQVRSFLLEVGSSEVSHLRVWKFFPNNPKFQFFYFWVKKISSYPVKAGLAQYLLLSEACFNVSFIIKCTMETAQYDVTLQALSVYLHAMQVY